MDRAASVTRAEPNRCRRTSPHADVVAQIEDLQGRIHFACLHALVAAADAVRLQRQLLALRAALD